MFAFTPAALAVDYTFTTIDPPGSIEGWAHGINDSGQIVGWWYANDVLHGFLATPGSNNEICDNGVDDDGDGLVDCEDSDCPPCSSEVCDNGVDDDGDGLVDCNDPDCPPCPSEVCDNGVDDDGDGLVDCDDPDCDCQPPVASFTYFPENPVVDEEITFDASGSSDPDGEIVEYEWDFGDGNIAVGEVVTHAYTEAGEYTVTLTVTDNDGLTNSEQINVNVGENLPLVEITKAKMVSPTELGMAVKVWFPEDSGDNRRFVKFTTTINGKFIEESFDVTEWTAAGEEDEIGVDTNGNLVTDTPLRINLKAWRVNRFIKNEEFELTAVAYSDTGGQSEESKRNVEILLPVVVVHGILGEFGFFQPLFGDPDALAYLKNYLIGTGYEQMPNDYPTIYYFYYSSLSSCVTDASALKKKIRQNVFKSTYADKVNIVAHSMGGLISRYSIAYHGLPVDKLIMIGTPNKGSTKALMFWADLPEPFPTMFRLPLGQLMPTYDYLYNYSTGELNTKLQKKFINKFLIGLNNKPLSGSTKYYSIFNSAHDTPKDISVISFFLNVLSYTIKSYGNGDDTVLSDSAKLNGAENIDIEDASNAGKHSVLPANSNVLSWVRKILLDE